MQLTSITNTHYRWLMIPVVALGLVWASFCLYTPNHCITADRCSRLHEGLTLSEIESILCASPGWYAADGYWQADGPLLNPKLFTPEGIDQRDGSLSRGWASNRLIVLIRFDSSGKALSIGYVDIAYHPKSGSLLEVIMQSLKQLWM